MNLVFLMFYNISLLFKLSLSRKCFYYQDYNCDTLQFFWSQHLDREVNPGPGGTKLILYHWAIHTSSPRTIEVLKGKKQQHCCSAVAFFFLMKTTDIIEGECSSKLRPKINIFKDTYLATYSVKIFIQGFIFFLWVSSLISKPSILQKANFSLFTGAVLPSLMMASWFKHPLYCCI